MPCDEPIAPGVTFIAVDTIASAAAFEDDAAQATPLLLGAGGALISRLRATSTIHGVQGPGIFLTMRFDGKAAMRDIFAGQAYAALIPFRDWAFHRLDLWIGATS